MLIIRELLISIFLFCRNELECRVIFLVISGFSDLEVTIGLLRVHRCLISFRVVACTKGVIKLKVMVIVRDNFMVKTIFSA